MRILVTGGAGFIGSYICDFHVDRGDDVICMDNFHTGTMENIKHLLDYNNFKVVVHDVTIPMSLDIERIYNFACPASPVHYKSDSIKTTMTNVQGSFNVLELARKTGSRVFQASTSEIYGDPLEHPQRENYWGNVNPIGLRSCYDEGKRCAESLFFDYNRKFNVDIRVARLFNTYGPRMQPNDGRVISNFIVQSLLSQSITIYGTGEQTRSFCFIEDTVNAIVAYMEKEPGHSGPINIGNPTETSVLQIANLVLRLTNSKSRIKFMPLPEDDPRKRKPDISEATRLLDWNPKIQIEDGLKKTIKHFNNYNLD